jgi:hypothetical protein
MVRNGVSRTRAISTVTGKCVEVTFRSFADLLRCAPRQFLSGSGHGYFSKSSPKVMAPVQGRYF